jgi:beta-phosphoglucomutase-like phosphatase (HAD superfamily)
MKLVIFDFDGLILDTETPDFESWQEVYAEHGVELPLRVWADCIGAPAGVFDPVDFLERHLGTPVDRADIVERRRRRFHSLVSTQPLCTGIALLVGDCQKQGIALAVASSATRDWVEGHLDRLGILNAFDCIRCVEDVERGKPAPDLFHAVLQHLDLSPADGIVLEDSPNGILAANRAGIYSIAVPNPVTRLLDLSHACLCVESLTDWPLARLCAHVSDERANVV